MCTRYTCCPIRPDFSVPANESFGNYKKKVNDICYYVSTFTFSHLASNVSHTYNTIIRDGGWHLLHTYLIHPFHRYVNTLQRLQSFCHQQIGESFMHRLHWLRHLQYPLFVGIGRVVIRRCTANEIFRELCSLKNARKSIGATAYTMQQSSVIRKSVLLMLFYWFLRTQAIAFTVYCIFIPSYITERPIRIVLLIVWWRKPYCVS